jgi:hypothetical protein
MMNLATAPATKPNRAQITMLVKVSIFRPP